MMEVLLSIALALTLTCDAIVADNCGCAAAGADSGAPAVAAVPIDGAGAQPGSPGAATHGAPHAVRDLEGVWSFATLTPFERPADLSGKPYFTDEEAAAFVADTLARNDRDRRDGGAAVDSARGVADFWFDRGTGVASLAGRKLTSLVVDPADGRVPPLTADARARAAARDA